MPKHANRVLRTVDEIVAALGGVAATAELLGVGPTAVFNWVTYGAIPPRWVFPIADALAAHGCEADRSIFRPHQRSGRAAHAS